jgi:hypothetical protein
MRQQLEYSISMSEGKPRDATCTKRIEFNENQKKTMGWRASPSMSPQKLEGGAVVAVLVFFLRQRMISAITATGKLKKKIRPNKYMKNQPSVGTLPERPPITPYTALKAIQPTIPIKNHMTPQYIGLKFQHP